MALSDFERYLLYDTSLLLMQQDMLTNSYFLGSSVGASLREMVLGQQTVQPITQPYDEAITGTLRADAAAVRQNARNVGEAASMMGTAVTAVSQIEDALEQMSDIIEKVDSGDLDPTDATVKADYDGYRDQIKSIISNTDYNSIFFLDSSQWDTEQIDSSGNVYIQAYKNGGFNVTFYPLDDINWDALLSGELSTDLSNQRTLVASYTGDIQTYLDLYERRQSSLEFQQTELESQAELLEQAALARRQSTLPELTAQDLLLSLILGDSGRILDEES